MLTPAQRVRMRKLAEQQTQNASQTRADLSAYELAMAQLYEHKRALKKIQSVAKKGEFKAGILADYEPYVSGVLAGDGGHADEVITTIMLWSIDGGQYPRALPLLRYCIKHGLTLPDKFQRTLHTAIAEELSEAVLNHCKTDGNHGHDIIEPELMQAFYQLLVNADMPDPVKGKLHKATALVLEQAWPHAAIEQFETSKQYLSRANVEKRIKALKKQIEHSAAAT